MLDNLLNATNTTRTSVTNLKKKLSKLRIQVEEFGADLEKIDTKFENILSQAEIYKAKLEREMGREVRRLEKELALLRSGVDSFTSPEKVSDTDLKVAQTVGIFEFLLRHMCNNADDFRIASEAFLYPAIYERVMKGDDEAYFLDGVPPCLPVIIQRGKEHIQWIRSEFDAHIIDPETWAKSIDYIVEWWRNDALPMIYGARDEQWDIDIPFSLQEILLWEESLGDRPLNFPTIFDAYEIYRKFKDQVYETSGLREFELKLFSFETEQTSQSRFGPR